jgi:hypothetical protein
LLNLLQRDSGSQQQFSCARHSFKFQYPTKGFTTLTKEEIKALRPEEILSEFHRSLLSRHAAQLFVEIWYHSALRNKNVSVVDDDQASGRARIPYQLLQTAQHELVQQGLMKIDRLNACARYEFLEPPPEPEAETDEQVWERFQQTL